VALICILSLAVQSGHAGQIDKKQSDYSKEAFVITSTETHVRFHANGTSERIQTTSVKIISPAGVQAWGVLGGSYASENQHIDVHFVRVHKANGAMVETPLGDVQVLPAEVTRTAPMYSDLKQIQIPVKALEVGDTLEFEFAYIEDKPLIPGQFWFSYSFNRDAVVLREVLEIRVPRESQLRIADASLKPDSRDDASEPVYTWTTANTDPTKPDGTEGAAEKSKKPSVQITTFATWQQVGEWYGSLAQPQARVSPQIQARADELVKGLPAGEARIQAIYDFVSTKIRYISLSFGIGRYQPHTANEVLENEYGDCKDKHTLLAALLKAEGIEAWPVLIQSSGELDEDVPSPGQFDHLITVVPLAKQYLWLDTTPEVAPYGMLLSPLRDKQALVMPASGAAFLIKTPANPPFAAVDHQDMRGVLSNVGTFKAHGELTLRGDNEVIYREVFHLSARSKWQDVMQAISYRLGFGGEVSNVQVDDPDATRKPFHISWDYERKKYGDWENRQITPPTGGIAINYINEDKKPKSPIQVGQVGTTLYTAEMELPAGSGMDTPADVDLKTAFAEYHARYSFANGQFRCERRTVVLKREVPIADWEAYVSFEKQIKDDYNHMISISGAEAQPPANSASDNPEAADLILKALDDFQSQQPDQAEDNLDKARKLNPHQTNLNAAYGSLYMMQGKTDEGIEAFRAELKEHPENLRVARWFAQMLKTIHRGDDAISAYRAVLKIAPDDVDATSELGRMLVEKQDWKEAQPVLEQAIQLRPDNAQVEVWYGQSCLQNGKDAEGVAALTKATAVVTDPAILSSVAVSLADAGKALDVAERAARRAVTLIEEQTASLTLASVTSQQMKTMVDLAQVWDRMSEVELKVGDIPAAEKYALAAWTLAQEPSAGYHLGQIYETQGTLAQALEVYLLAQSRGYPVVAGLDDRVNALRKRLGHNVTASRPGHLQESSNDRLQNMRIVHLPLVKPLSASADFLVMFANGKPPQIKMLGGDARLEPLGDSLKLAKFNTVYPDEGPEHIVRQGILSCSSYDRNCMFLMMLPPDAGAISRSPSAIHPGETRVIEIHQ
jgi:tetratricopeptide (TPR) repeat protein